MSEAPNPQCVLIVPPTIQVLMSGVRFARHYANGDWELEYTDGQREKATGLDLTELTEFFSIVSAVQCKARKEVA